jgi:serine/threonine protein kinase
LLNVKSRVGSWIVEDLLGFGLPRTYRVRHAETGTQAQLKTMPISPHTEACQRREIAALQLVAHPSLPEVVDCGVDPEAKLVWTVFRWFEGESLIDRLQRGPIAWDDACVLFRELAEVLACAHARGVVHRDLQPANVMMGEHGEVRLCGFDFAMTLDEIEMMREAPMGELAYLAPEVLGNPRLHGTKADTYALGCLLYEALTGAAPFPAAVFGERADAADRMLEWKARSAPLDPGTDCPDWLRSLVSSATQPDPDRRLPDIGAVVGWLDGAKPSWERVAAPPIPSTLTTLPIRLNSASMRITQVMYRPRMRKDPPLLRPVHTPFPVASYVAAASLGCVSAMAFSGLLIALVELGDRV